MSRKVALLIGNSEYEDSSLAKLVKPSADVAALAKLLLDPKIGGFDDVKTLLNESLAAVQRATAALFAKKQRDNLLLLYFSGHGVMDEHGHLYLAVKDTERDLLSGTALSAAFVATDMNKSRSRRQVLILDCCHSGAFARGAKGSVGASVGLASQFDVTGYGRVVLTATDSTQYAWEDDDLKGAAEKSVFTHYLTEGLRTGEADEDSDGFITVDELYDYVYERVIRQTPKQTPHKWADKQQGKLVIARNPHPVVKPAELPREVQEALEGGDSLRLLGAVHVLNHLLLGADEGVALSSKEALVRLKEDDSRRVSEAAKEVLAKYAEADRLTEEEAEPGPEIPARRREHGVPTRREHEKTGADRFAKEKADLKQAVPPPSGERPLRDVTPEAVIFF